MTLNDRISSRIRKGHDATYHMGHLTMHFMDVFKSPVTFSASMNIALRRLLHNHGNIATEGSRDYAILLFLMTSMVLNSAQYHRQHCTLHAFEQFICTTTMKSIRPDQDSNLVAPGYKPQSIQMSHRARNLPASEKNEKRWLIIILCLPLTCIAYSVGLRVTTSSS